MENKFKSNNLLKYFKVESHEELMNYIKKNPKDPKVAELKDLLTLFDIYLDSGVNGHE